MNTYDFRGVGACFHLAGTVCDNCRDWFVTPTIEPATTRELHAEIDQMATRQQLQRITKALERIAKALEK